jgi:erythromycin esterase
MARQNLAIVKQAEVKVGDQSERGKSFRDRAMAENVKWILDQEPPGTRMMLWAHNGHVTKAARLYSPDSLPMGEHLLGFFGDRLVSCGFVFGQGSFRAVDMAAGGIQEFRVGPPPQGSVDATLGGIGLAQFIIDLRGGPAWFAEPRFSRQIGAGYAQATPGVWMRRMRAAREFDLLIYVDRTTPSR